MTAYADLELGIHRREAEHYTLEMRFSQPESDADTRLLPSNPLLQFDVAALREQSLDDSAYGRELSKCLFADTEVRSAFAQARGNAQALEATLRLRLFIGPGAPELHNLRWETLRDPQTDSPLLTSEQVLFSRYLSSLDWRPVRLRAQTELRALVVIANPENLTDYNLAPVDVAGELERAETGLGNNIRVATLAAEEKATLNTLSTHLREGYDILYLVCHGALIKGEPRLWLEDEAGQVKTAPGSELVTRLQELPQSPRLVVLSSCQSAGTGTEARTGDEGALAALGPRLAEAGIPAVLAMQGNVSMQTVAQFMPVFFAELQRDGQIDRALAVARGEVRERPDWWMPVLFMRLKSGLLWYRPGFADDDRGRGAEKWPALQDSIIDEECTPIIGPDLTEAFFGSREEIARRLAQDHQFPMAHYDREHLPQVAQYVAVKQSAKFLPRQVIQHLCQEIQRRYRGQLPEDLEALELDQLAAKKLVVTLSALLRAAWQQAQQRNSAEPHRVLAALPFPIYITTDPSDVLAEALRAASKEPRIEICPWNEHAEKLPSARQDDPDYDPEVDEPLVYHLFGHIQEPRSLVLTEDDYFDHLIGVTSNKDLIPEVVRAALVDSTLLFLGFRMDDWNFRVLFRSILGREGRRLLDEHAHIAAQVTPEEGRILEPEGARRYLETYFKTSAGINIYWGSVEDFVTELQRRWESDPV